MVPVIGTKVKSEISSTLKSYSQDLRLFNAQIKKNLNEIEETGELIRKLFSNLEVQFQRLSINISNLGNEYEAFYRKNIGIDEGLPIYGPIFDLSASSLNVFDSIKDSFSMFDKEVLTTFSFMKLENEEIAQVCYCAY